MGSGKGNPERGSPWSSPAASCSSCRARTRRSPAPPSSAPSRSCPSRPAREPGGGLMAQSVVHDLSDDASSTASARPSRSCSNLRFQHATGQLDNARLRQLKREIARLHTEPVPARSPRPRPSRPRTRRVARRRHPHGTTARCATAWSRPAPWTRPRSSPSPTGSATPLLEDDAAHHQAVRPRRDERPQRGRPGARAGDPPAEQEQALAGRGVLERAKMIQQESRLRVADNSGCEGGAVHQGARRLQAPLRLHR